MSTVGTSKENRTELRLPTVERLSNEYGAHRSIRPRLILITHVLPTAVAYIKALCNSFDVSVIAIPYSVNKMAAQRLARDRHEVHVPASLAEIPQLALSICMRAVENRQSIVVQEIGGYLAEYAQEFSGVPKFMGVVEDTNNGHWRYESRAHLLDFPVISIAHSPIKALEDMQIGEAVAFSVERILRHRLSQIVRSKSVLIIGFGSIGNSCSMAFRQRGAFTSVYDLDPLKLMRAHAAGFTVGSLADLASRADIVIGATGHCSIDGELVNKLQDGSVVASASSRQLEIDLAGLRAGRQVSRVAAEISRYSNGSNSFFLLNDGFPINFRDHSVVGRYLDAVYSELFVCVREVEEGRAKPGLHSSWKELHQEVSNRWCSEHLPGFSESEALEGAPRYDISSVA